MEHSPGPDNDLSLRDLVERLDARPIGADTCFLCGRSGPDHPVTREHVIPRWAQNRYGLWDQKLVLLNDTSIPYRFLTIPCCRSCNSRHLQPIETRLSAAVLRGPDAVRNLGPRALFLWLGKIFYGILYKETSLVRERGGEDEDTIVSNKLLAEYRSHLLFLQEARGVVETANFSPGSYFVFRTQQPSDARLQWDLCDNTLTMFVACRMGQVGLVGVMGDGGAQQAYDQYYRDIIDLPLHPLQFRELCARICYLATLATRTPKFLTIEGLPHKTHQMPLGGFTMDPLFERWEPQAYAKFLSHFTGYPVAELLQPPDRVITWLRDDKHQPRYLRLNEPPDTLRSRTAPSGTCLAVKS